MSDPSIVHYGSHRSAECGADEPNPTLSLTAAQVTCPTCRPIVAPEYAQGFAPSSEKSRVLDDVRWRVEHYGNHGNYPGGRERAKSDAEQWADREAAIRADERQTVVAEILAIRAAGQVQLHEGEPPLVLDQRQRVALTWVTDALMRDEGAL